MLAEYIDRASKARTAQEEVQIHLDFAAAAEERQAEQEQPSSEAEGEEVAGLQPLAPRPPPPPQRTGSEISPWCS